MLVGTRQPREDEDVDTAEDEDIVVGTLTEVTVADIVASVESWFAELDAITSSRPPHAGDSAAWDVVWS